MGDPEGRGKRQDLTPILPSAQSLDNINLNHLKIENKLRAKYGK